MEPLDLSPCGPGRGLRSRAAPTALLSRGSPGAFAGNPCREAGPPRLCAPGQPGAESPPASGGPSRRRASEGSAPSGRVRSAGRGAAGWRCGVAAGRAEAPRREVRVRSGRRGADARAGEPPEESAAPRGRPQSSDPSEARGRRLVVRGLLGPPARQQAGGQRGGLGRAGEGLAGPPPGAGAGGAGARPGAARRYEGRSARRAAPMADQALRGGGGAGGSFRNGRRQPRRLTWGSLEGSLGDAEGRGAPSEPFGGTGASWREARLPERSGASGVCAPAPAAGGGWESAGGAPLRGAASGGDPGSAPGASPRGSCVWRPILALQTCLPRRLCLYAPVSKVSV